MTSDHVILYMVDLEKPHSKLVLQANPSQEEEAGPQDYINLLSESLTGISFSVTIIIY